jgi:hypothetical protein
MPKKSTIAPMMQQSSAIKLVVIEIKLVVIEIAPCVA